MDQKSKMSNVYVCYEENDGDIAAEIGTITDLTLFSTKDKALAWFNRRFEQGIKDGFILDIGSEFSINEKEYDKEKVASALDTGYLSLIMFYGVQLNWRDSYSICVTIMGVN